MATSLRSVGAITLFVEDVDRSKSWYRDVFEAPVVHEDDDAVAFKFDNTIINLLRIPAADELIAPAVVGGRQAGSQFQLTVWVDDADAACEALQHRGVTLLNGPMDREWGQRTAAFADPDGHIWEIAQSLS